jgi:hypothetical protein
VGKIKYSNFQLIGIQGVQGLLPNMGLDQGNDTKVEQHHEQIALDLKKNRSTLKEGKMPAAIAVPIRQQMV